MTTRKIPAKKLNKPATTTKTKGATTPVVEVEVTQVEEVKTDENKSTDLYYSYPVLERGTRDIDQLQRIYNARSLKNEQSVDEELLASIKEIGIQNPIIINTDNQVLDGHRRFHHAKLAKVKSTPVIVIDIKREDWAYFQYLTGLEKGYTKEEKESAILKHAVDNPDQSDREIARKFGISHTTVSNITKICRSAPVLSDYVLSGAITKNVGLEIVETARRHKQSPDEVSKQVVAQLIKQNKIDPEGLSDKPVTRAVTTKILNNLIPKANLEAKQSSRSTPTSRKLLKDLFGQLKPVGDQNNNKQEYTATLDVDLIKQIEDLLNNRTEVESNERIFGVTETKINGGTLQDKIEKLVWKIYVDHTADSEYDFVCLLADNKFYCCEDNADYFHDILQGADIVHKYFSETGIQWCVTDNLTLEQLTELAKNDDLSVNLINIQFKVKSTSTPVEVVKEQAEEKVIDDVEQVETPEEQIPPQPETVESYDDLLAEFDDDTLAVEYTEELDVDDIDGDEDDVEETTEDIM